MHRKIWRIDKRNSRHRRMR